MGQQVTPFAISAPGFYGLNLSDSAVDLSPNFALQANNCVIDKSGRIASRKGWEAVNSTNSDLDDEVITCIGELIENDGTSTVLCTGGGFLFKKSTTTLTTLTYGGGGVAPTISANDWKFCQMNGVAMFWQRGYDPLIFDPADSTTEFRRLNERTSSSGTVQQANEAIAAFGRVWCADLSGNKNTVYFSDTLTPHIWTGGTSGSLNLLSVWPAGGDEVVALAAHNNFLYIFGRRQILVYQGASTPSTMTLQDTVVGIGCISRDSVKATGNDIIFLSDSGVRSLQRTIQEKSAPLTDLSKNITNDLQDYITSVDPTTIKSVYSQVEGFYLLILTTAQLTYCLDLKKPLPDGSLRITTWTTINPQCAFETKGRILYLGQAGYLGEYSGYSDNSVAYRISYFTTWVDFGTPILSSILKRIIVTLIGATNQTIILKWAFDFIQDYTSRTSAVSLSASSAPAEYGIAEWDGGGEYGASSGSVNVVSVPGSGTGKVLQFGIEAEITTFPVSIQKIELYTKDGRY